MTPRKKSYKNIVGEKEKLLVTSIFSFTHFFYSLTNKFHHITTFYLSSFNPFPNKPWFLRVCSKRLLKKLWEKGKLLVTSNFSFSHNVFYPFGELSAIFIKFETVVCRLFQFGNVQNLLCGKELIIPIFEDELNKWNEWCFMARRQLRSYWAHLGIRLCIYFSLYCETLKWNTYNKEATLS